MQLAHDMAEALRIISEHLHIASHHHCWYCARHWLSKLTLLRVDVGYGAIDLSEYRSAPTLTEYCKCHGREVA